jgi:hypothetical protein
MYAETATNDKRTLGPWVRRFLMEHLPDDRNLSRKTQQSYRETPHSTKGRDVALSPSIAIDVDSSPGELACKVMAPGIR